MSEPFVSRDALRLPKARRANKDLRVCKAHRANKVFQDRKGLKEQGANKGLRVRKAHTANKGLRVCKDLKAQRANKACPVHTALRANKGLRVRKGLKEQKATKVRRGQPVPLVSQAHPVPPGQQVFICSGKIRVTPTTIATSNAARVKSSLL